MHDDALLDSQDEIGNELAHHRTDDAFSRLARNRQTFAEVFSPVSFVRLSWQAYETLYARAASPFSLTPVLVRQL
jgi:hypothetical protein